MNIDCLDRYRRDELPVEKTVLDSVNLFNSKVLIVGKPGFLDKVVARAAEVTATENFEWKFKEKHYDTIIVHLAFRNTDLDKVVWKMYNSLKSKGKLVIFNISENPFAKLAAELGMELDIPSEQKLKDLLFEVGFRITRLEKLKQYYQFEDVGQAMLAIKTNGIFGKHVPEEKIEQVQAFFMKSNLIFPAENHLIIGEKMSFE